jgi:endonuclease YncB( thermonuclease family)
LLSKLLVPTLLALVLLPAADAQAATCSDYSTQAHAQRAHDTIDADHDGIYCESLPCPCLKPGQSSSPSPKPSPKPKPKPRRKARVYHGARITSVADGDTIRVRLANGRYEKVRLIGIDTPETKDPGKPVECGGPQATSEMLHLAFTEPRDTDGDGLFDASGGKGRRVVVRTDPTQDMRDRYGRLLAYVTTTSDSDVADADLGAAQLLAGWAKVYVFERNFQRLARYRTASNLAKQAGRGAWSLCGGNFHRPQ